MRYNVEVFILWCKDFGVPEISLMDVSDLVEKKSVKMVLNTSLGHLIIQISHLPVIFLFKRSFWISPVRVFQNMNLNLKFKFLTSHMLNLQRWDVR